MRGLIMSLELRKKVMANWPVSIRDVPVLLDIMDIQNDFIDMDAKYVEIIQWSADRYYIQLAYKSLFVYVKELPMYIGINPALDEKIAGILG